MRKILMLAAVLVLVMALPAAAAPAPAPDAAVQRAAQADDQLQAYTADVDDAQRRVLHERGLDPVEVPAEGGGTVSEIVVSAEEAAAIEQEEGIDLTLQTADAETLAEPEGVFRPWSGPGGLREELLAYAEEHPDLIRVVTIGQSIQGQDILAFRVTRGANRSENGAKPASLYSSTQHAREWITPEMNRRLLRYMVDGYGNDPELTRLLNRNEFWFVPVMNPDGYDFTFTEGNRLWRKNLRDNNGDGQITGVDGVDLNRNYPYRWGYDNEGSSPNPSSGTYRGASPGSEPETQAMINLWNLVDFSFQINYHSAAELNLYGVGWQVDTRSPDDLISIALTGTDDNPAVPIYDPDLSAELYTTNGELTNHAQEVEGVIAFTPEMSTCQTVSALDPADEWLPTDCVSIFTFPDDEELIQEEFERNIPFALSIARSTANPDEPVSAVGIEAPDFAVDSFEVSYGSPQQVEVVAERDLGPVLAEYRINGGRTRYALAREWNGGERYGGQFDRYYRPLRATIRGTDEGDEVEVTFRSLLRNRRSESFTYTVENDSRNRVLIVANEDYTGFNPVQDTDAPRYVATYGDALEANGIGYDVWDIDAQGAPHHLGVLSHYDAIVWETGDNRITQNEEDTDVLGSPDLGVADVQQFTTLAVRDYLNEGGKVFYSGEYSAYFGPNGILYYADDDQPDQPCTFESDDCLFISNDFFQYYLGIWNRVPVGTPGSVTGTGPPLEAESITVNGGDGADNQDDAGGFTVTSDLLPADQFPLFASTEAATYGEFDDPYQPVEGDWYVGLLHDDDAFERLGRTIDLTGATSAQLAFQLSYDTEFDYDVVAVEARAVGTEEWTTLPDLNGRTTQGAQAACSEGLFGVHPQTAFYLTTDPQTGVCSTPGSTGEWNVFNGNSEGWRDVAFDLSAYTGQQVEVQIAYISDVGTAGLGVFVDDVVITVDGVEEAEGFETDLGAWSASVAPGSPDSAAEWVRSQSLVEPLDPAAAVTTEDSVTFGFGFEAIATQEERNRVMGRVMDYLLE